MYHRKGYRKLGRDTSHRLSMLNNMVVSVVEHGGIITTESKAKTLRPYLERIITKAKTRGSADLALVRELHAKLKNAVAVKSLFEKVAKSVSDRNGGYTRIIKLCKRKADGTTMARIELVDYLVAAAAA